MQFRDNQEQIIKDILQAFTDGNKVVVFEGPTGTGKSPINLSVAKALEGSYYTTTLRILVEQLKNDLSGKFLEDKFGWAIMGRKGYDCLFLRDKENESFLKDMKNAVGWQRDQIKEKHERALRDITADGAPCQAEKPIYKINGDKLRECPVRKEKNCMYYLDKEKAMNALTAVTTFDYYMYGIRDGEWPKKSLLIIDEAHFLPSKLADFFSINISKRGMPNFPYDKLYTKAHNGSDILSTFQDFLPSYLSDQEDYLSFLVNDYDQSEDEMYQVDYFGEKISIEMALKKQQDLVRHVKFIKSMMSQEVEWIFIENENGMSWKPYSPEKFVEDIWKAYDHILLSSATFFDIQTYMSDLGLGQEKWKYIQTDSLFPPQNSPIIPVSQTRLNKKNFDMKIDEVVREIDAILEKHPSDKGLIHCHTYPYQTAIAERSKYAERFILHTSKTRQKSLNEFMTSDNDKILLSVAMGEGLDLKDDLARFQILVKAPYPYLGDPWTKLHFDRSSKWYRQQTIITIMQMCGRIVRSKEDHGITYFVDAEIMNLLEGTRSALPKWFVDRIDSGLNIRKENVANTVDDLLGL